MPIAYKHRDYIRVLHSTSIDTNWTYHFEKKYMAHIAPYVKNSNDFDVSKDFAMILIIRYTIAVTSVWLSEDLPIPPEGFQLAFKNLMYDSINTLILPEYL
ncbi:MAG TPA: hypothetical protein VGC17_05695 [Lactovum miscens]